MIVGVVVGVTAGAGFAAAAASTAPPGTDEPGTSTPAESGYPVTVDHAFGSTTIDAAPERIVALGIEDADIALALGVTPIAIPENRPVPVMPWTQAAIDEHPLADGAEVEVLSWGSDLPFEQIAALEPDLILAVMAGIDEPAYETLSGIAPTLAHQTGAWSDPWRDQTREIAAALDRSDAAEQLIAGTEAALADSAAAHPDFAGATFSVALVSEPGTFGLLNDPDAVTLQILAEYGMEQNPAIAEFGDQDASQISLERADLLDSDVAFVYWFDPALADEFAANPLYSSLGVVERDAVISVGDDAWRALRSPSVLSMPWVVDVLAPQIAAALG